MFFGQGRKLLISYWCQMYGEIVHSQCMHTRRFEKK
eukprot:UN18953